MTPLTVTNAFAAESLKVIEAQVTAVKATFIGNSLVIPYGKLKGKVGVCTQVVLAEITGGKNQWAFGIRHKDFPDPDGRMFWSVSEARHRKGDPS